MLHLSAQGSASPWMVPPGGPRNSPNELTPFQLAIRRWNVKFNLHWSYPTASKRKGVQGERGSDQIPLIIIMLVAICTTKIPIFLNKGFWAMAHEARTDWSMLLGSIFLLIVGAGPWSV